MGGVGTDLPHSGNLGKPYDIGFWALFLGVTLGHMGGHLTPGGQMGGGRMTPGMDPYREVSRTGPPRGVPVASQCSWGTHPRSTPPGAGPRGPCGAGLTALRSLQRDFVLQALGHGAPRGAFGPAS